MKSLDTGAYAPSPNESASATLDPTFTIDPTFADAPQYSIILSEGIGNQPAQSTPVPEPGTLAVLVAALLGLIVGSGIKRGRLAA